MSKIIKELKDIILPIVPILQQIKEYENKIHKLELINNDLLNNLSSFNKSISLEIETLFNNPIILMNEKIVPNTFKLNILDNIIEQLN
jgi:hypothetical protein